jgi:hypothetical protein
MPCNYYTKPVKGGFLPVFLRQLAGALLPLRSAEAEFAPK